MNEERWKDIIGYEGMYQVSDHGRIKTLPRKVKSAISSSGYRTLTEKIHIPCDNGNGYKYVTIRIDGGKNKHVYIHRAVAEAFLCNCFDLPEVNHIDGVKSNNHVDNLEWCTRSDNVGHAHKTGLNYSLKGESNPQSKLTEEKVRFIRESISSGEKTNKELSEMFGISNGYISNLVARKKWKHVV
jgi:hypothetical protein